MKGKKLFNLIESLSSKEMKLLVYRLSLSKDKRDLFMKNLLKKKHRTLETLNDDLPFILKINSKPSESQEADKQIRRFVDYASKQIEDLKLTTYLQSNSSERNRLLSQIYLHKKADYLSSYYVRNAEKNALKNDDLLLRNQTLDWQINIFGRQQKEKNSQLIKTLLHEKKEHLNFSNHEQLSFFYRLTSNLYLDNTRLKDDESAIFPKVGELTALSKQSLNQYFAADYLITRARFSFFSERFSEQMETAFQFIETKTAEGPKKEMLWRRYYFLKLTGGVQHNQPLEQLLNYSARIFAYNQQFQFADSFSFFYHLLLHLLNNDIEQTRQLNQEFGAVFFTPETNFYNHFIEAMLLVKQDGAAHNFTALHIFTPLKYSPNYYISLWSMLFEFTIHFTSGNLILCKSLVERLKSFLYQNKHRQFMHAASTFTYNVFRSRLSGRKLAKKPPTLTPIHDFILQIILEKNDETE